MLIFSVSSLIKTWRSHLWLLNQSTIKGIFIKKYIFLPVFIVSQFLSATPEDRVYIENIVEKSPDAQQFVKENPERYEAILKIINLLEGKLDKNQREAYKEALLEFKNAKKLYEHELLGEKIELLAESQGLIVLKNAINEVLKKHKKNFLNL